MLAYLLINNHIQSMKPDKTNKDLFLASRILALLIALVILASFFVIVSAGERGVLMRFGQVQEQILDEGIHPIIPLVNSVQKLSVRVQKQEVSTEASSRDLQDVFTDVALNWHIVPEQANLLFQQVGTSEAAIERIITPAVEEVLKAVVAQYTAEEVITRRSDVKAEVDALLAARLAAYHLAVNDVSLVQIHFSQQFGDAVEAKQIAEQEAKRAGFLAIRAAQEAEAKINLAKGEAEAQRLIDTTLTPTLLRKQTVDRWDGKLPLITGDQNPLLELELEDLLESSAIQLEPS
jgi:regulator of protease activity HflC (stomatin/prohibitin superfamily)